MKSRAQRSVEPLPSRARRFLLIRRNHRSPVETNRGGRWDNERTRASSNAVPRSETRRFDGQANYSTHGAHAAATVERYNNGTVQGCAWARIETRWQHGMHQTCARNTIVSGHMSCAVTTRGAHMRSAHIPSQDRTGTTLSARNTHDCGRSSASGGTVRAEMPRRPIHLHCESESH